MLLGLVSLLSKFFRQWNSYVVCLHRVVMQAAADEDHPQHTTSSWQPTLQDQSNSSSMAFGVNNTDSSPSPSPSPVLVVGHCCHDSITTNTGSCFESLGGSASYISNVFDALDINLRLVSKVGPDFAYFPTMHRHPPSVVPLAFTTEFFADFSLGDDRVLRTGRICESIFPSDIPSGKRFNVGLAVGIVGEISAETLEKMADVCDLLVVDVQALIRTIDPDTGLVGLRKLDETPFYQLLHRISYLKAASNEALFIDIEHVRQRTSVIVTEGKHGCTVYCKDRDFKMPAFKAQEKDPTGAGDSFLAGFSAGLCFGFSVQNAALMGNYFGALAVAQAGVPKFSPSDIQKVYQIVNGQSKSSLDYVNNYADGTKGY